MELIAQVKIKDAKDMDSATRKKVASWLRRQAKELVSEGHLYSSRFNAKYFVKKEDNNEMV